MSLAFVGLAKGIRKEIKMQKNSKLFVRIMAGFLAALMAAGACYVTLQFIFL